MRAQGSLREPKGFHGFHRSPRECRQLFKVYMEPKRARGSPREPRSLRGSPRKPKGAQGSPMDPKGAQGSTRKPKQIPWEPMGVQGRQGSPREPKIAQGRPRKPKGTLFVKAWYEEETKENVFKVAKRNNRFYRAAICAQCM
jgi:hypothetical protein